jgi:hypothetical protein
MCAFWNSALFLTRHPHDGSEIGNGTIQGGLVWTRSEAEDKSVTRAGEAQSRWEARDYGIDPIRSISSFPERPFRLSDHFAIPLHFAVGADSSFR